MIQLNDAISEAFPQGNDWAAAALDSLSEELAPDALVHAVVEGWMRRGTGPDAELVDTLFVLTSDRLGLGRTDERPGEPRWVTLVDVVAVDAVDDSPLPLQTIELEQRAGGVLCVGWPDWFSDRLIPILVAIFDDADRGADSAMPRELAEPPQDASVSDLESTAPSGWIEQEVAAEPRPVTAALDFFNTPPPAPGAAPVDLPVAGTAAVDAWTTTDPRHDVAPLDPAAFDPVGFEPVPFEPVPFESVPLSDEPVADEQFDPNGLGEWMAEPEITPAPVAREPDAGAGPPPWEQRGMVWPDPLRGVLYLGGHPGHPRKRKNGSMIFSPAGLVVSGSGFQSWEMSMDWAFVHGMEIQGPDEILFGDDLKIDSTSSALIVTMVDETRMFFEIRTRRPPSLRSALAPVLLMVENIRSHRAATS